MSDNSTPDLNNTNHSDFFNRYANPVPSSMDTPLPDGVNEPVQPGTGSDYCMGANLKKIKVDKPKTNAKVGPDGIPDPLFLTNPMTNET